MVLAIWFRLSLVTFLHSTIILRAFFAIISHLAFSLRRRNNLVFFWSSLKVFGTCRRIQDTAFWAFLQHISRILVLFLFPFFISNSNRVSINKSNSSLFLDFKEYYGIKNPSVLFLISYPHHTNSIQDKTNIGNQQITGWCFDGNSW